MLVEIISIMRAMADLIVITVISSSSRAAATWSAKENKTLTKQADNRFNYGQSSEIELGHADCDGI